MWEVAICMYLELAIDLGVISVYIEVRIDLCRLWMEEVIV